MRVTYRIYYVMCLLRLYTNLHKSGNHVYFQIRAHASNVNLGWSHSVSIPLLLYNKIYLSNPASTTKRTRL